MIFRGGKRMTDIIVAAMVCFIILIIAFIGCVTVYMIGKEDKDDAF